jgi:hypothetical protein
LYGTFLEGAIASYIKKKEISKNITIFIVYIVCEPPPYSFFASGACFTEDLIFVLVFMSSAFKTVDFCTRPPRAGFGEAISSMD